MKISEVHKNTAWITDDGKSKEIIIKKINGEKVIIINGEKIDEEDIEGMDIHMEEASKVFVTSSSNNNAKKISIKSSSSKDGKKHVYIHSDSEGDEEVHVINDDNNFIFVESDGNKPLFVIDGKSSTEEAMKDLSPSDIATINVFKGKAAKKKYGKKAKNGVVEIITKKE